jgi:hypothetical protein
MDKFLDTYNHPKLNQEDINHLNRAIALNEFEGAILSSKTKFHDLMDSPLNSHRLLKKNKYQHSLNFPTKWKRM